MSTQRSICLILILLTITVYFYFLYLIKGDIFDSDSFYHFSISKIMSEQGFIQKLPQLTFLGWDKNFVDKEFFYHLLTTVAYYFGGEYGVKALTVALGLSTIFIIYYFCFTLLQSPFYSFLLTTLLITSHPFLHRITMIRPQVLSIFLYVALLYGLLVGNRVFTFFSSLLHPLSYHTFYFFPYHLGTFYLLFKNYRKTILISTFLFLCGIIINPYFPHHIIWAWMQTKVAFFSTGLPQTFTPMELRLPPFSRIWTIHLTFWVLFLFQIVTIKKMDRKQIYLFHLSALFYVILFFNYRILEYAFPVVVFTFAITLFNNPHLKKSLTAVIITLHLFNWGIIVRNNPKEGYTLLTNYLYQKVNKAFEVLPQDRSIKVCNCSWTTGNNTLYMRPKAQFVDLLDPSFLYNLNPDLHANRESLVMGEIVDPWTVIHDQCQGEYFTCQTGPILIQLEEDLRFKRLTPALLHIDFDLNPFLLKNSEDLAIYQLIPEVNKHFLSKFQIKNGPLILLKESQHFLYSTQKELNNINYPVILTLGGLINVNDQSDSYLAIGGKWDYEILFQKNKLRPIQTQYPASNALIHTVYKLPRSPHLSKSIEIKLLNKHRLQNNFSFLSISLWSKKDLKRYCDGRPLSSLHLLDKIKNEIIVKYPNTSLNLCTIIDK